jgi:hypothetical protein
MLARTYLSAEELKISARMRDALVELHGKLLRGEIPEEKFDMGFLGTPDPSSSGCGTAGCLLGWALSIDKQAHPKNLENDPDMRLREHIARDLDNDAEADHISGLFWSTWSRWRPTTSQAAVALGHYLATGNGIQSWKLALNLSDREVPKVIRGGWIESLNGR